MMLKELLLGNNFTVITHPQVTICPGNSGTASFADVQSSSTSSIGANLKHPENIVYYLYIRLSDALIYVERPRWLKLVCHTLARMSQKKISRAFSFSLGAQNAMFVRNDTHAVDPDILRDLRHLPTSSAVATKWLFISPLLQQQQPHAWATLAPT